MAALPDILLVEDDPNQRAVLSEILRVLGYRCKAASSCVEGKTAIKDGDFACGLIDVGLPDGSGTSLIPDFLDENPQMVMVMLTGDGSADTVIDAMRAGAFDYLTKPVDTTTLKAALSRAIAHHRALQERDEYNRLLLEERELLKARIEAATADLRQYAASCELSNARLQSLIELTQVSAGFYTHESLLRRVFEQLQMHIPLQCVALCDVAQHEFLASYRDETGAVEVTVTRGSGVQANLDSLLALAEPGLLVQSWVERFTGIDTRPLAGFIYPQTFWGRTVCTVGFYLDPVFTGNSQDREFLGMCAHFVAFEWQQARLLLHAAHHASLGTIAVEMSKSFLQCLTAIRTATDFIGETGIGDEAAEGLKIILDNVERLAGQTQEFRKLSTWREGCVETVRLDEYVNQAVDMLEVAMRSRNVTVERHFAGNSECVLLNGTGLARTVLDLVSSALRAVEIGGRIRLSISECDHDHIALEMVYNGAADPIWGRPTTAGEGIVFDAKTDHPKFQLAQRTVHSCGGTLSLERTQDGHEAYRIVLPRNATTPKQQPVEHGG